MKYGYCLRLDFLKGDAVSQAVFDAVTAAGFDYVELPFRDIWGLSPEDMVKLKKALQVIPCKACNIFFPGGLTLVGPNKDEAGIRAYLAHMLPLAADLGVETLVFGNGGARKVPEGSSKEATLDDLRSLVEIMNEYAAKAGIIIAIEPLNTTETDTINSYGEAVALSQGLSHVTTMIDSYHVAKDGQTYDDVYQHPAALGHLHTAYPIGRMAPSPQDDMAQYAEFVKMVKQLGYDGMISVEGGLKASEAEGIAAEVRACLDVLRRLFE